MNKSSDILNNLISESYVSQGLQSIGTRDNQIQSIMQQGKMPKEGLDNATIEYFLQQLSFMDSNNFENKAGVGEREGRVFSSLVSRRHYNLAHGIGRSGDIIEVQPKAAGSSIIYKLTNKLAAHALQISGIKSPLSCVVFPLATGMTLALAMLTLKSTQAASSISTVSTVIKSKVIWSRIDQKSCLKSILLAGLEPITVDPLLNPEDGTLTTDIETIERILQSSESGPSILCILSTTSCFAPRQPDRIDLLGELANKYSVGHIVNNAYGLQCSQVIGKLFDRCYTKKARIDCFIQSTDKNFLVPVGGAILATFNRPHPSPTHPSQLPLHTNDPSTAVSVANDDFLARVCASYPGRASSSPIVDLFITLLTMGEKGYRSLLEERQRLLLVFQQRLQVFVKEYGLAILPCPKNTISMAISLQPLLLIPTAADDDGSAEGTNTASSISMTNKDLTFLGSMLFRRNVSGCRVVVVATTPSSSSAATAASIKATKIGSLSFINWGAHHSQYPSSYFTVACSIGMQAQEVDIFFLKLIKTLKKFKKLKSLVAAVSTLPEADEGAAKEKDPNQERKELPSTAVTKEQERSDGKEGY